MDASGARELQRRIEQCQQWQQAAAVREGRQAAHDPDQHRLTDIGDGVRFYDTFAKRLVDGWWQVTALDRVEPA